ncbi:MAG: BON domain-containing protein [Acidobacteria bacterium]|nr:BON domain-containing protein [Acidobacteriota bacterium]
MRFAFNIFVLFVFFVSAATAQNLTREQKIQELQTLGSKVESMRSRLEKMETRQEELEEEILAASDSDLAEAGKENASAFRIFPRGLLDDKISIRGGAAYYSFTSKTHDYNETPQIELQNGDFSVGFYGANFGFISDAGEITLSKITEQNKNVNFLINYRPPTSESEARNEYQKAGKGFDANGANYKKQVSAIVGHTYILRAVSFDEADTLVAFKVYRKDTDGSLIIFWKNIENFETPKLERNKTAANSFETSVETIDHETAAQVQNALNEKGLFNVSVEATNKVVILRGTVPKGKMADAVMHATETGKRKVRNELTEQ